MGTGDLAQINDIDREAFPTQWPAPNYRQELQNHVAHYIVLSDDTRPAPATETPSPPGPFARLMRRLWRQSPGGDVPTSQFLVGFSGIWMMAGEAHITNIAVRRDYQGRGLGELLLIATIELAARLNAAFLTLEVRVSNRVAQRLYEKYGFVRTGLRRSYYLDNHEDAVIMSTQEIDVPAFRENLKKLRDDLDRKRQRPA
jgi:[ribosomal protein S18]-alanine N-acetyltransferase